MSVEKESPEALRIIEQADAEAGRDNAKFVRALNRLHGDEQLRGAGRGARAVIMRRVVSPVPAFHIYDDPRFLANARTLAKRTTGGMRIIGGRVVPAGQFMDCVAVGNDAQFGCTGTLIAPNVVVTAGHCVDFATRIGIGADVSSLPLTVIKVKKKVRHPKYHKGLHNDLMVLVLAKNVVGVTPRALATKAMIDAATDARVVGFGNVDAAGTFGYGVKRYVDIPIASNSCEGSVGGHDDHVSYGCDPKYELVAGRPLLAQDTCTGDSGGPIYLPKGNGWVLAGATSRATDSAMNNCGDGGVYVRIDKYRAWIASIPGVTLP